MNQRLVLFRRIEGLWTPCAAFLNRRNEFFRLKQPVIRLHGRDSVFGLRLYTIIIFDNDNDDPASPQEGGLLLGFHVFKGLQKSTAWEVLDNHE